MTRRILLAVLVLALSSVPALSQTTTLTGTIRNAQGNLFNGFLRMRLSHSAVSSGGFAVVPTWHTFRVRNGTLPPNAILVDTDTLTPVNTYYIAEFTTTYGTPVARSNYSVSGTTFDIGAAPLTTITTSQVGFANPVVTNPSADQEILDFNLITPTLNNIKTLGGTKYPCSVVGTNSAIGDLPSTGGVVDARGCGGAQTYTTIITVNKPVLLLLGATTIDTSASPGFNVTADFKMLGIGKGVTILRQTTATANMFTVAAQGSFEARNLSIRSNSAGSVQTAGAAISITGPGAPTANNQSRIDNVEFVGQWIGVDFGITDVWKVAFSQFNNTQFAGIRINNTSNGDQGDNETVHNVFASDTGQSGTVAILQLAGGVGKVTNNKFFRHDYAYRMNWTTNDAGGQLIIANNRSEPMVVAHYRFERAGGSTGTFSGVVMEGNYARADDTFTGTFLDVPTNAAGWISHFAVGGMNHIELSSGSAKAVVFGDNVGGSSIFGGNLIFGSGTTSGFTTGTGISELVFGTNLVLVGSGGAYNLSSGLRGNYYPDNFGIGITGTGLTLTERVLIPNDDYYAARNAAGGAQVRLIGLNTSDGVALAPGGDPIRAGGELSMDGGRFSLRSGQTLDDTGTPSVGLGNFFTTTGTTAITAFDDGTTGQVVHIRSGHVVTITDGAALNLAGAVNYPMTVDDTLTLVFDGTNWYEIGRSVN